MPNRKTSNGMEGKVLSISLEDCLEMFHRPIKDGGWGLPRKPHPIFVIINKLRKEESFLTDEDMLNLVWWARYTWGEPRYKNFQTRISHARIELRQIVGNRSMKFAEQQKLVDKAGAARLRERMHDLIGTEE